VLHEPPEPEHRRSVGARAVGRCPGARTGAADGAKPGGEAQPQRRRRGGGRRRRGRKRRGVGLPARARGVVFPVVCGGGGGEDTQRHVESRGVGGGGGPGVGFERPQPVDHVGRLENLPTGEVARDWGDGEVCASQNNMTGWNPPGMKAYLRQQRRAGGYSQRLHCERDESVPRVTSTRRRRRGRSTAAGTGAFRRRPARHDTRVRAGVEQPQHLRQQRGHLLDVLERPAPGPPAAAAAAALLIPQQHRVPRGRLSLPRVHHAALVGAQRGRPVAETRHREPRTCPRRLGVGAQRAAGPGRGPQMHE